MSLNTRSMLRPTILNGKSNNQTIGNNTIITRASGQHSTKSRHHKMRARSVFTAVVVCSV